MTDLVKHKLDEGQTVILIDQFFRGNSFLKGEVSVDIFEFSNFKSNWQDITMNLKKIATNEGFCVLHTNLDGVRGADFKVKNKDVHVILAFVPQKSYDILKLLEEEQEECKQLVKLLCFLIRSNHQILIFICNLINTCY